MVNKVYQLLLSEKNSFRIYATVYFNTWRHVYSDYHLMSSINV